MPCPYLIQPDILSLATARVDMHSICPDDRFLPGHYGRNLPVK